MKRRELYHLISGLVIGVLLGIALQEVALGGTAGTKSKAVSYYMTELGTAEDWLVKTYPAEEEKVQSAMRAVSPAESVILSGANFVFVAEDAEFLLQQIYGALTGEEDAAGLEVKKGTETTLCLALEDDPYAGSKVYLYLTIPADEAKQLEIPNSWEKLNKPKNNELYWQLVACFPEIGE